MRNVMQEQDVTDWKASLAAYVPETEQERRDRNEILVIDFSGASHRFGRALRDARDAFGEAVADFLREGAGRAFHHRIAGNNIEARAARQFADRNDRRIDQIGRAHV